MHGAGASIGGSARLRFRFPMLAAALIAATTFAVTTASPAPAEAYSELRYVTRVLDGDTIEIALPGQTSGPVDTVRFAAVNTNETGSCHAAEATARTRELLEHKWITISADDPASRSADGWRLLRFIEVDGIDVGLTLLQESLAIAQPNGREPSRNRLYAETAKLASLAGEGIWDPTACGSGPRQGTPLRMIVDWDAPGPDGDNVNGEYFRVHNDGTADLSMDGWAIRDSGTHIFPLPANARIPAGGYLTVHVGAGNSTATRVYLGHPTGLFSNDEGDGGFLLDPDNDIRAHFTYPCVLDCTDPLQGKLSITANWDAVGSDATNPNGEWIDITNTSASSVDLFEYVLANDSHRYDFPEGTAIPAGRSLRVYVGSGNDTAAIKYWGLDRGILNNTADEVLIETYDRIEIASFKYPCTGPCSDPMQGRIALTANYNADGSDSQNVNGEWVNITNISGSTIDLSGYLLTSGGAPYFFGDDPIHPGERLRIHVGNGSDTRLRKYWGKSEPILGNTADFVAVMTPDVRIIDRFEWPCSPCGPTPSLRIVDWQADVPGPDSPNDEWIDIENQGTVAVDLRDWLLRDNVNELDFKASRLIQPGQKLRVYVGSGTDTAGTVYWGNGNSILFGNDVLELWTPHRDLRSCTAWGTQTCAPVVSAPSCNGLPATMVGTSDADTLVGTAGRDVIVGLGGADHIDGRGGNDIICGGSGNDTILGGAGNDYITGNRGADTVSYADAPGGVAVSLVSRTATGHGTDTLAKIEHIIGSDYGDTLEGDGGANRLYGRGGADTIKGRAGSDRMYGGGGADVLYGAKGDDRASGGAGKDRLEGGDGADELDGNSGFDVILGFSGRDTLRGNRGDDTLRGGAGADTLYGGAGIDFCRSGSLHGCEL